MNTLIVAAIGAALAASVRVRAIVDEDLTTVRGSLELTDCECRLVDPLPLLPSPADDRVRLRTFPGRDELGLVTWTDVSGSPQLVQFEARLPRRYGDVGRLPGRGLWADGGWYPLPVDTTGQAVTSRWDVEVTLPPGVVGVLNGEVGTHTVRWEGYADRAALAVLADGLVSEVQAGGGKLVFVESGRGNARRRARVAALVEDGGWPLRSAPDLTLVQDLDLLHLATSAPGMVYLSARAFRVSPGLVRYHGPPVRRAMVEASVPRGVGWERSFVGGALTRDLPVPDLRKLLGVVAWNPVVDALLNDGTLPYYDAIFDEPFPAHPGLFEVIRPRFPAPAAARQLDQLRGKGSAVALSRLLLEGLPLQAATTRLGIPADLVAGWLGPYPHGQDYVVREHEGAIEVERRAPVDAAAEVVVLRVDERPAVPWIAGPGPDRMVIESDVAPRRVHLDPDGQTRQVNLANDRWPVPWTFTFAGHFYGFSPTQKTFDLVGDILLRRENDTHNVVILRGAHHPQDIVGGGIGYAYAFGPLLDRQLRPHRVSALVGASVLDPAFDATTVGQFAFDATLTYTWDTRLGDLPLRGHRVDAELGGGMVAGTSERWARALLSAVQLVPITTRQVLALRLEGGWASGRVTHRLLPLGGNDALHGVPLGAVLANERITLNAEYRVALFRNLSIPLPLVWLTELQLAPGIEGGAAWFGDRASAAVAATLGIHTLTDAFGVRPAFAGVTLAVPVATSGFAANALQVYVDFTQSF